MAAALDVVLIVGGIGTDAGYFEALRRRLRPALTAVFALRAGCGAEAAEAGRALRRVFGARGVAIAVLGFSGGCWEALRAAEALGAAASTTVLLVDPPNVFRSAWRRGAAAAADTSAGGAGVAACWRGLAAGAGAGRDPGLLGCLLAVGSPAERALAAAAAWVPAWLGASALYAIEGGAETPWRVLRALWAMGAAGLRETVVRHVLGANPYGEVRRFLRGGDGRRLRVVSTGDPRYRAACVLLAETVDPRVRLTRAATRGPGHHHALFWELEALAAGLGPLCS